MDKYPQEVLVLQKEDAFYVLKEDGWHVLLEQILPTSFTSTHTVQGSAFVSKYTGPGDTYTTKYFQEYIYLQKEDGDYILTETGKFIRLEQPLPTSFTTKYLPDGTVWTGKYVCCY